MGILGCSVMRWLVKSLREVRKASSIIMTQNFKHVDFSLFKELVNSISWESALEGRETHESCLIFKDSLLKAAEQSILMFRMLSRYSKRPA